MPQDWRDRLWAARDPGLLILGAVLLVCAPALPGPARVIVLPALLLAPGYAFLRLLRLPADWQAISVAVPASIVLIICAGLILDVSGIKLDPVSLGFVLGAVTALFLAGAYSSQLLDRPARRQQYRRPPLPDQRMTRPDMFYEPRRDRPYEPRRMPDDERRR